MAKNGKKTGKRRSESHVAPRDAPRDVAARVLALLTDGRVIGLAVLYVVTCVALLFKQFGGLDYREGVIAETDVTSPRNVEFVDRAAMEEMKTRAADGALTLYRVPPDFSESVNRDVNKIFMHVLAARESGGSETEGRTTEKLGWFGLEDETIDALYSLEKDQPVTLRLQTITIIKQLTPGKLMDENSLERLNANAARLVESEGVSADIAPAVLDVIRATVRRNLVEDSSATLERRRAAVAQVSPITRIISRNEIIVRKGDRINERHLEALRELGLASRGASWSRIAAFALLVAVGFAVIGAFIKTLALPIYQNEKKLYIFYMLVFLTVVSSVVLATFATFSGAGYMLGAPIAAFAIMVCVLLAPSISLVATPVLAIVVTFALGLDAGHFLVALTAGLAAHYFSIMQQDRDSFLKAGLAVSLSNMVVIFILTLMSFSSWQQALLDVFLFGGLNGVIATVAATGSLPAFERVFNVTTSHRLLELSNPEEPFLKQMLINAPGTYYHSFFVGNLAETVAEALGANALLVRVACYYHDIGKLKRPYFFIENIPEGQSRLDDMSPTLGALVISSHVKDGAEMARESSLPDEIRDIIRQHHGTTMISFFHNKARAAANGNEVSEENFRYPGPRPRTIEAAIVMLADSCEAAVRSIPQPTPKLIETTVNDIVEARLFDRQFDECNITLKQIDTLRITLKKTLANVYHSRMEYPDLDDFKAQRGDALKKVEQDG